MSHKGFDILKEQTINVSADELWQLVGPGFVEVYKWSSNVDYATGSGESKFAGAVCSERACEVNVMGFSSIKEKLTNYDQEKMSLTYEVNDGMPGFITKAENQWTVVPISHGRSKLVMKAVFRSKGLMGTLMNAMMKKKMDETLVTVLNDAKVYAETGEISSAKRQRMSELARKAA